MKLVIFDDAKWQNFFPITLTRSISDLRVGILKLRQRILSYFETSETHLIVSSHLEAVYKERHPDWLINEVTNNETLFINSRVKIDEEVKKFILSLQVGEFIKHKKTIIAARFTPEVKKITSENLSTLFTNLKEIKAENIACWEYTWELISENSKYITKDFKDIFYDKDNYFETELGTTIINPYNVWIGEGSALKPGVVVDATEGPVVIDENALIMPNTVIIGPVYIGKNSTIKAGAKIYEGTSIGPVCKIGGEVEETIFQGYTNKQHDGFLGHSYLGEWINLGADTNNSDLKNNYGAIAAYFYPDEKKIDTQINFLGTIIGDHSKTGINTTINTGTVIGIACSLFSSELVKNYVPNFSIGTGSKHYNYELSEFLDTAQIVKKRRNLQFSDNEKELYTNIYKKVF